MARILIVDDEPLISKFLRTAFSRAGYEVAVAGSAATAMDLARDTSFDLMLSDVQMPQTNGHQLARWMAAQQPDAKVVLMSGLDLACERCPYSPRCKLLHKPFKAADVVAMVASILAGN